MIDHQHKKTRSGVTLLHWLGSSETDFTITSPGEYVLPFLLAALEACWVNGVLLGAAGVGVLDSLSALLPFWAPLLLLWSSLWFFRSIAQEREDRPAWRVFGKTIDGVQHPGPTLFILFVALCDLVFFWLHLYASSSSFFDFHWLLAAGEDVLALNLHFYQLLVIVALSAYLCWRGMSLSQLRIEPGHVRRQFWIGLGVFLGAILLRSSQTGNGASFDDTLLLVLLPIFLYFALAAHALARLAFIRRDHPIGLDGSTMAQERATLGVISMVGLLLLLATVLCAGFFRPAFFGGLQAVWYVVGIVYGWLVNILSFVMLVIILPFYWVGSWLAARIPWHLFNRTQPPFKANPASPLPPISHSSPAVVLGTNVLLWLLISLALVLLFRWGLRRRRTVRVTLKRRNGDLYESVWSWMLFRRQFHTLWTALWRFLLRRTATDEALDGQREREIVGPPAVRTVREIYRAFLKRAEYAGHRRRRDETAYEFELRLGLHVPQVEPQLSLLTESYSRVRYGGNEPDETELASVRQVWQELESKWGDGSAV